MRPRRTQSGRSSGSRWAVPALLVLAVAGSRVATPAHAPVIAAPGVANPAHIAAGGLPPPGPVVRNPYRGDSAIARAGGKLFVSMHCSDCHGDAAAGAVGPNLGDGRWRYGATDAAVFRSIYFGRPRGMPAFGGVLGAQGVWVLVTYLRSLPPPADQPTERFSRH